MNARAASAESRAVFGARPFTLLEVVVVLTLIGVLVGTAAREIWSLRADAERVAVKNMLGTLNSAIGIKVAASLAEGDESALVQLVRTNPMRLLAKLPENYAGEVDGDATRLKAGNWYFDRREHYLVYVVRYADHFQSAVAPAAQARFVLEPVYEDASGNGIFDPRADRLEGLRLVPVEPFKWTG